MTLPMMSSMALVAMMHVKVVLQLTLMIKVSITYETLSSVLKVVLRNHVTREGLFFASIMAQNLHKSFVRERSSSTTYCYSSFLISNNPFTKTKTILILKIDKSQFQILLYHELQNNRNDLKQ